MSGGRALAVTAAGLAASAGMLWVGTTVAWPEPGPPAWPGAVALLAMAGVAGVVATSGVGRRLVGALLALAGLIAAVAAGFAVGRAPLGAAVLVLGGLLLTAAGATVAAREPALARFGARYDRHATSGSVPADPDRAAWDALDDGADPTVDRPDPSR